jgi:hypothetical protein
MSTQAEYAGSGITEEFGFIAAATVVKTVEVTGGDLGEILINALAHPDNPVAGEPLSIWVPHVRVQRRTPKIVGLSVGKHNTFHVQVTTEYGQQREITTGDGAPAGNNAQVSFRGGASLTSIQTAKRRDGTPIEVEYRGDKKRGEINAFEVQGHLTKEFVWRGARPETFVQDWINYVNVSAWMGGGPEEWLCTRVDYQLIDAVRTPMTFGMVMDFERRPTKWVYTVAYRDGTGQIPGDVSDESVPADSPPYGIKDIHWHSQRDFNSLFPAQSI